MYSSSSLKYIVTFPCLQKTYYCLLTPRVVFLKNKSYVSVYDTTNLIWHIHTLHDAYSIQHLKCKHMSHSHTTIVCYLTIRISLLTVITYCILQIFDVYTIITNKLGFLFCLGIHRIPLNPLNVLYLHISGKVTVPILRVITRQ